MALGLAPRPAEAQVPSAQALRGAWTAQRYVLAGGPSHEVRGSIFFAERDWQVLFFVVGDDGVVRRGSGEGGTYAMTPEGLVFTHLFHLSAGDAMDGLPAADLRMVARSPEGAPTEPTRLDVNGSSLTLHFPSGNRMTFERSR